MARSRRPGSSKTWTQLSPSYRARLEGAGVDRKAWLAGVDLRGARSHAPGAPVGAAPPEVISRVLADEGSPADLGQLREWQAGQSGEYYYDSMGYEAAAALSQLHTPPERWASVQLTPRDDGRAWTMTVTPVGGGYPETIQIPGGGASGSGAGEILKYLEDLKGEDEDFDYDVTGSGE